MWKRRRCSLVPRPFQFLFFCLQVEEQKRGRPDILNANQRTKTGDEAREEACCIVCVCGVCVCVVCVRGVCVCV